jgi:hypothetical protein
MNVITMTTQTLTDLEIFRSGRSLVLDQLAREQAIIDGANETDLADDDAAMLNAISFRNRGDRNFFKNQYRRHARNIAAGNPFYN